MTAIGARRSLYLQEMAFKNQATKSNLQKISTIDSDLFLGKYFVVLQANVVNIRDLKENQRLSDARGSKESTSRVP